MTIGIRASHSSEMAGEFIPGNPWYYTPPPYPIHNSNFLHPFQPPEYTHPPTPPVFHPFQPPPPPCQPYTTTHIPYTPYQLECYPPNQNYPPLSFESYTYQPNSSSLMSPLDTAALFQPVADFAQQPEIYAPQVFDESPVTLLSISDATHHQILDKCKEMLQQLEKMDEICKGICSTPVSQSPPMSTRISVVDNSPERNENVEDDSVSVLGGNAIFNGSGDASDGSDKEVPMMGLVDQDWVNEKDEDKGLALFKEAVQSEDTTERYEPWNLAWDWDDDTDEDGVATEKGEVDYVDGYQPWELQWDWDNEVEEDSVTEEKEEVDDVENNDSDVDMGLFETAMKVLDEMPMRDIPGWLTVLSRYCHDGQWEKAWELFERMKGFGISSDSVNYTADASSCARLLDLERGTDIHYEILSSRFPLDSLVSGALIGVYVEFNENFCVNREKSMIATRMLGVSSETTYDKVPEDRQGEYLMKWRYKEMDKGRYAGKMSTVGTSALAKSELYCAYFARVRSNLEVVKGVLGDFVRVVRAPGEDAVKHLLQSLFDKGSKCMAIMLMHSYNYPEHEIYVAKMNKWVQAIKIMTRALLDGKKQLYVEVFSEHGLIREGCFIEMANGGVLQLLKFSGAVKGTSEMFKLCDVGNLRSGGAVGAPSLLLVYSLDCAQTCLINDAKIAKKGGERQSNGLVDVHEKILASDGIVGPYHGFDISRVGMIVYRGLCVGIYYLLKLVLSTGQLLKSFLASSAIGGVITNGASLDTVRRNVMMISGASVKYKSSLEAFKQILKNEGAKSELLRGEIEADNMKIALGKYDEAINTLRGAVQTEKDSEERAMVFVSMAKNFCNQEKFANSKRCLKTACGILDKKETIVPRSQAMLKKFPQEQHSVVSVSARIGWLLSLTGKVKLVIPYLEEAAERLKEGLGSKHYGVGYVYNNLGAASMELDRPQLAPQFFAVAYVKKSKLGVTNYPSPPDSTAFVEPYISVLSTHPLLKHTNVVEFLGGDMVLLDVNAAIDSNSIIHFFFILEDKDIFKGWELLQMG